MMKLSPIETNVKKALIKNDIQITENGSFSWSGDIISEKMVANFVGKESFFASMSSDSIIHHVVAYRNYVLGCRKNATKEADDADEQQAGVLSFAQVSIPFELFNVSHIPTEVDKKYLSDIYYYIDEHSHVSYMYKDNNTFTIVPQKASGQLEIESAFLSNIDFYSGKSKRFEDLLNIWSKNIVNIYNANHTQDKLDDEPVNKYARENIPITILSRVYITIKGQEYNANTDPKSDKIINRIRASHVTFNVDSTGKKRLTYADYVQLVIDNYPYSLNRLAKMPDIYSNDGNSFTTFNVNPYMVDDTIEMNDAWKEFFSKFTEDEKHILLAMIWGIFYSKNTSRMGIWIYDSAGYSGKSAFLRALTEILGHNLVANVQKDSLTNQFWAAKIWNRRLVVYADCANRRFVTTEKYHQITGSDGADVEDKGQKSFFCYMQAKMVIASNSLPELDPTRTHERSRLVLLMPKMTKEVLNKIGVKDERGNLMKDQFGHYLLIGDSNFTNKLVEGAREMLINAYQQYKLLCPTDADYIVPESVLANIYNLDTAERISYDSIFSDIFVLDEGSYVTNNDLYRVYMDYCAENPVKMASFKSSQEFSNFKNYLTKDLGLTSKRLSTEGRPRVISGLRPKRITHTVPTETKNEYSEIEKKYLTPAPNSETIIKCELEDQPKRVYSQEDLDWMNG